MTSEEARNSLCMELARVQSAFSHLMMSSTLLCPNAKILFVKEAFVDKIKALAANLEMNDESWLIAEMMIQCKSFFDIAIINCSDLPKTNIWTLFDEFYAATFNVHFYSDLYLDGAAT